MTKIPDLAPLLKASRKGEEAAKAEMASLIAKASLDPYILSKDQIALEIRRAGFKLGVFDIHDDRKDMRHRKAELDGQLRKLDRQASVLSEFQEWYEGQPFVLQKPDRSRLGHFLEEINSHRVIVIADKSSAMHLTKGMLPTSDFQCFVVQHDWTQATTNAEGIEDNHIPMPYEYTAFEFRVSDKHVIALTVKTTDERLSMVYGVLCQVGWAITFLGPDMIDECEVSHFLLGHIKAISLLLETQLVVATPTRGAHLSNEPPGTPQSLEPYEFHTLSLANRKRYDAAPSTGTHSSPRLHFRRGHWRHFQTFKTWVRWTVAGTPDLGYIEKEYTL